MKGGKGILSKYISKEHDSYLNLGSGSCLFADYFTSLGKRVTDVDIAKAHSFTHPLYRFVLKDAEYFYEDGITYDAIVANHVLEHIQNTGNFLTIVKLSLKKDGVFYIAVPPFKHRVVSGHVHHWTMGILMYNLVLRGFDVMNGKFIEEGYNLIGIVGLNQRSIPKLRHDAGDIEILVEKRFLPELFLKKDNNPKRYNI